MTIGSLPGYLHFSNSGFYLSPWLLLPCLISTDICWVSWTELWTPNVSCKVLILLYSSSAWVFMTHDSDMTIPVSVHVAPIAPSVLSCIWMLCLLISTGSLVQNNIIAHLFWAIFSHCHSRQLVVILSQALGLAMLCKSLFPMSSWRGGLHRPLCFLFWVARHGNLELKNFGVVRKIPLINLSFHKWENVVQDMYSHFLKLVPTLNLGFLILSPMLFQKKKRRWYLLSHSFSLLHTTHLHVIIQIWACL